LQSLRVLVDPLLNILPLPRQSPNGPLHLEEVLLFGVIYFVENLDSHFSLNNDVKFVSLISLIEYSLVSLGEFIRQRLGDVYIMLV
jgi:hypothetical protein